MKIQIKKIMGGSGGGSVGGGGGGRGRGQGGCDKELKFL